ncbi:extracellular solute-binding protein [bacterium]|nr:extracellular solute-binding protein [bacterium]
MRKTFIVIAAFLSITFINANTILTFWHPFQGNLQKTLVEIVKEYNNSQDDYEILLKCSGNYKDTKDKLLAIKKFKGMLPDIFIGYSTWIEKLGETSFYNINEVVSKKIIEKIDPVMLQDASSNNKQYGLPFNKSIMLIYVNTDTIDRIGIDIKKYNADQLYKLLEDIHKRTNKPAMSYNLGTWFFENLMLNMGGDLEHIDSPSSYRALNLLVKAYQKKYIIIKSGYSFQDYWTNENVPIIFTSIVSLSYIKDKIKFNYKRYNFLSGENGKTKTIISGANLFFVKTPKKKVAIKNFISWLYSYKNLKKWFDQSGYLPIYTDFKEGSYLKTATLCLEPKDFKWYDKRKKISALLKKSVIYKTIPDDFFKNIDK